MAATVVLVVTFLFGVLVGRNAPRGSETVDGRRPKSRPDPAVPPVAEIRACFARWGSPSPDDRRDQAGGTAELCRSTACGTGRQRRISSPRPRRPRVKPRRRRARRRRRHAKRSRPRPRARRSRPRASGGSGSRDSGPSREAPAPSRETAAAVAPVPQEPVATPPAPRPAPATAPAPADGADRNVAAVRSVRSGLCRSGCGLSRSPGVGYAGQAVDCQRISSVRAGSGQRGADCALPRACG